MNITFEIFDSSTDEPIEDVLIQFIDEEDNEHYGETDSDGMYTFEDVILIENSSYEVTLNHDDYDEIERSFAAEHDAIVSLDFTDYSNMIRVGQGAEVIDMHPLLRTDIPSMERIILVNEPLFVFDEGLNISNHLATNYEINDDGQEIIIDIRENVEWHHEGYLSAEDVKYTYQLILDDEDLPDHDTFNMIEEINILDDYQIQFRLSEPNVFILNDMTRVGILPEDYHDDVGFNYFSDNPVGTGPYMQSEDDSNFFEAYDNYWAGEPNIDYLRFDVIPEDGTRLTAIENQEIDLFQGGVLTDQISNINANNELDLYQTTGSGYNYIGFNNLEDNPLSDIDLRRAISHLVDREYIVDSLLDGIGQVGKNQIMPDMEWFNDDLDFINYNSDIAKDYFQDSEVYEEEIELSLYVNENPLRISIAESLKEEVEEHLEVNINIEVKPWDEFLDKIYDTDDYDMFILGWGGQNDPNRASYRFFHSEGSANHLNYSNSELDGLLEDGRRTDPDSQASIDIYHEVQEIINDEAPLAFVNYNEELAVSRAELSGFEINPYSPHSLIGIHEFEKD